MGTIAVHEFVSLDGVFEDPSWTAPYGFPDDQAQAIGALTGTCTALLLGRRTWEMFAPAWSARSETDDPGVAFFNGSPKHVVSSSPVPEGTWQNSVGFGPYAPDAVRALKDATDGGIYVSGSGTLVRALLADGLVDELHLFVYPVVLGAGARLFSEGMPRTPLARAAQQALSNGVAHLTYAPAA